MSNKVFPSLTHFIYRSTTLHDTVPSINDELMEEIDQIADLSMCMSNELSI